MDNKFWINTLDNSYVEGDKPYGAFWAEVPQRPDYTYEYSEGVWTKNDELEIIPEPTLQDIISVLPQASKDALATRTQTKVK